MPLTRRQARLLRAAAAKGPCADRRRAPAQRPQAKPFVHPEQIEFIVTRTKKFRPDEPYSLVTDEELGRLRYATYHALERGEERGALSLLKQYINSDPEHIRSWRPAWVIVKQASRHQDEENADAEALEEPSPPPSEEPAASIHSWWTASEQEEAAALRRKATAQTKVIMSGKRDQRFVYFFFWGWVVTCRGRVITVIPWSGRKKALKSFEKWCKRQAQRQADALSGVLRTLSLDGGSEEEDACDEEDYDCEEQGGEYQAEETSLRVRQQGTPASGGNHEGQTASSASGSFL